MTRASLLAERGRRGDHDDLVEALLGADLEEQRHLGDADPRRLVELRELLAPLEVLARDERVEQLLEPREPLAVAEHRLGDLRPVGPTVVAEDLLAEPRDERVADVVVRREQVVDDLVARDRRGAVRAERLERRRLAGADAAGDRDRDRTPRGEGEAEARSYAGSSSSATLGALGSSSASGSLVGPSSA